MSEATQAINLKAPNAFKRLLARGSEGMKTSEFCETCRKLDNYELPLEDLKKLYKAGIVELLDYGNALYVRYMTATERS